MIGDWDFGMPWFGGMIGDAGTEEEGSCGIMIGDWGYADLTLRINNNDWAKQKSLR